MPEQNRDPSLARRIGLVAAAIVAASLVAALIVETWPIPPHAHPAGQAATAAGQAAH
jgi:hypothetical protein